MARIHILLAGIMIPGLLYVAPAVASEDSKTGNPPGESVVEAGAIAQQGAALPETPFAGSAVVDETTLDAAKGMADVKVIDQTANVKNIATVSGNVINGDPTTGSISIDGASFGNFTGMALINTNTGNNVSINSAMNVNVAIQ